MSERRRPPATNPFHLGAGEADAAGGGDYDAGQVVLEDDHAYAVTFLVGVLQQGQHRSLRRLHPRPRMHGGAGVQHEYDQAAGTAAFHLGAKVGGRDRQLSRAGSGRGGPQRRIQSDARERARDLIGNAMPDVPAALFTLGAALALPQLCRGAAPRHDGLGQFGNSRRGLRLRHDRLVTRGRRA